MLQNFLPELRHNPEKFVNAVMGLVETHGYIILDCGCKIVPPDVKINLVELENGLFVAVCDACSEWVAGSDGTINSKFNC